PAVAHFDAAGEVEAAGQVLALRPDRNLVRFPGPFGVFQDLDAVARLLALGGALGVLKTFDDPEAAALVHGEGDGVDDVRLRREYRDLPAGRHLQPFDRLLRRQVGLAGRLAVVEAELLLTERGAERTEHQQGGQQRATDPGHWPAPVRPSGGGRRTDGVKA